MTIEISTDSSNSLTIFKGRDVLSFEEIKKAIKSFYDAPSMPNVLWDLQQADLTSLTREQLELLADNLASMRGDKKEGKTALVAQNDLAFGLSRIFETLTTVSAGQNATNEMRVFRDLKQAYDWFSEPE